ncbi:hypothetical protein HGRIS_003450 [Hohenbuehelia grisea]|uniref:DUF6534 domain-containing protein n=1 Tax=Hohenbuehelia grisea TaxID=104357 RepID=A0ABR3JFI1_9AGAR
MTTVFTTYIAQMLYARTVWKTSQNRLITAFIICTSFGCFGIGLGLGADALVLGRWDRVGRPYYKILAGVGHSLAILSDLAITLSLYFYFQGNKNGFRRTDTLLDKLTVFVINRGVMNFIFQVVGLILFVSMDNLYWSLFHSSGARVYTISVLALLNRRKPSRWDETINIVTVSDIQEAQNAVGVSQQPRGSLPVTERPAELGSGRAELGIKFLVVNSQASSDVDGPHE